MAKDEVNAASRREFLARMAKTGAVVAPVVATFAMTSGASASALGRLFPSVDPDAGNNSPADPGATNTGGSPADPGATNTGGGGAPTDPNAGNTGGGDVQGGYNYRLPRSSALPDTR